jgi:hypothetical protein
VKDARTSRTPYLLGLFLVPSGEGLCPRSERPRQAIPRGGDPDCIYRFMVVRRIYPLQAPIIGILLAIIPYILIRDWRIASRAVSQGVTGVRESTPKGCKKSSCNSLRHPLLHELVRPHASMNGTELR